MRFFSLLALVLIGVFVLVGLTVTGPIMRRTVADTLAASNAYDLRLFASDGLEDEDLRLIGDVEGVRDKEYFHTTYLTTRELKTVYLSSLPRKISRPVVKDGRLPRESGEILLDRSLSGTYKLNDVVRFEREENVLDKDAPPVMNRYTFKVVGFATDPRFLDDADKGKTPKGDKIDGFAYVMPADFKDPTVTEVHFLFDDLKGLPVYSDRYEERNAAHKRELKTLFAHRGEERLQALLDDRRSDIKKGESDIKKGYDELEEGKKKLDDGEKTLADGERALRDNRAKFASGISEGESKLAASLVKLQQAKKSILFQQEQLSAGEKALLDGKNAIAAAMADIQAKEEEAKGGLERSEAAMDQLLKEEQALNEAKKKLEAGIVPSPDLPQLPYTIEELDEAREISAAAEKSLPQKKAEVKEAQEALDEAKASFDEAARTLKGTGVDGDGLKEKIEALETTLSRLKEEKAQREIDSAALDEEIRRTEKEKADLEEKLKDPSYMAAQKTFDDKKQGKEAAEEALARAQAEVAALNSRKKEAEEKIRRQEEAKAVREAGLEKMRQQEKALLSEREALEAAKKDLAEKEALLLKKNEETVAGRKKAQEALESIAQGKADLRIKEAELNEKEKALIEGKAAIVAAKSQWEEGEEQYASGARQLAQKKREGARKLDQAAEELLQGRDDLDRARAEYEDKRSDALKELVDGQKDVDRAKELLTILKKPDYVITPLNEETRTFVFLDYADRVDKLSAVFPVFLFSIAMLLASTVMNRMVDEARIWIGTYKALGYDNGVIGRKYVRFGTLAALLGGIPGAFLGNYLLSRVIADAYLSSGIFDQLSMELYPGHIIFAVLIGMVATGLVAYVSVWRSLKLKTAALLLPKQPAKGTRIFLERIKGVWSRLSFFQKVTARNLFRDKKRMVMTIVGVMGCVALLVLGFGIRTSVDGLVEKQFDILNRYDHMVLFEPLLDKEDHAAYEKKIAGDKNIRARARAYMENLTVDDEGYLDQAVTMIVPEREKELDQVITLRNRKTQKAIHLKDGVAVTEKLAAIKGVKVGDTLSVKDEDDKVYDVPVAAIAEGYAGHNLYMDSAVYEKIFHKTYKANVDLVNAEGRDISYYKDFDSVVALTGTSDIRHLVDEIAGNINLIVFVILAASSTLAVVVLSTLTNINIEERRREISTIRVLGFYPKEVTRYIYRETGVLTSIGILLGFLVGRGLHLLVIRMVVPDFAMLDPGLDPMNYLLSAAITLVLSVLLMAYFHRKLQTIDMVEALKSVE